MRLVPVSCVKEGSFLAKTIYDTNGILLLSKGFKLTRTVLKKIEESGIFSVYINDEYSNNEIEDIIKPELRQKAIKTVKSSFESIIRHSSIPNSSANKKLELEKRYQQLYNISKLAGDIVDDIASQKNVVVNLVDIKSMDNYTYEHSISVTVLSIVLGLELKYDRKRLTELAVGALLHDVGKVFVPKEYLQKKGRLTDAEFKAVKEHTVKGYDYIKGDTGISFASCNISLQHHEKFDGTGYPHGLKGEKIHEYARIVAIADVYDALTSDRPYRRAVSPNEALELIMGSAGRHFDINIVNAFVKKIVPYPEGTLVKLSNGEVGVIEETNPDFPLRPKVKAIRRAAVGWEPVSIDLMLEKNIVIEGVQYNTP